jgi:tartrate-resistant acid phosphatase type 5
MKIRSKIAKLITLTFLFIVISFGFYSFKNRDVLSKPVLVLTSDSLPLNKKTEALNFLIIGDWGRGGDYNQTDVADQMNHYSHDYNVNFIISTGDNFYVNGVRSVDDPQWNSSFENIYHGGMLQKDWYVVLGNHDYRGSPEAEIAYTQKSRRWNMPARYFSVTKKIGKKDSVCFVFYDSSPFVKKYYEEEQYTKVKKEDTLKQLKWINNTLSSSKAQWKIVVGHHPVYSSGLYHGNTVELIGQLKPILLRNHVQAYISGHEHVLQHIKPKGDLIDYFISGAGSETGNTGDNGTSLFTNISPGFAFVSLTPDSLKLFFISYQGKLLYKASRAR